MKKTRLLLVPVMLMLTALSVVAQNTTGKKFPVQDIPFGKKLPLPDPSADGNVFIPQKSKESLPVSLMPHQRISHANAIGKKPEYYRQLFLERKKMQASLSDNSRIASANRGNNNNGDVDFHLTKDIDSLAESNPKSLSFYSDNSGYAVLNDVAYFAADDGIHGLELWRSDGTESGTYLIKDIYPGLRSGFPINITAVNGKIYFKANSPGVGGGVWVSDGTESGTQFLVAGDDAGGFFARGNKVDFISDGDFSFFGALWETDGTVANTIRIIDIGDEGDGGEQITQPTLINGTLFFTFLNYTSFYWELWKSDGTDTGTHHLATNTTFPNDPPLQLTNYNGKLYFSADDGTGRKLWSSDGTDAGTVPVQGNNNVLINFSYASTFFGYYVNPFPVLNNSLYIPGSSASMGTGLYKYHGSNNQGVVLVKDIVPNGDTASVISREMAIAHHTLYFKVTNNTGGAHDELWSSEGTEASTKIIDKLLPGGTINNLYDGNGTLYFVKYDKFFGTELWKVFDTFFGSFPIIESDVFKGPTSSYPYYLTAFKGRLMFGATDEKKGNELFMTNRFGFGASIVKDINTVATTSSYAGIGYAGSGMVVLGNDVLFNAYENVHGFELYKSDGTTAGTQILNDIVPGELGDTITQIISKSKEVYFIARTGGTYGVYRSDGTKNGLRKLTPDFRYIQGSSATDNGIVFYIAYNYNTFTYELWRTDGTAAGNFLLSSTISSSPYLTVFNNTAFYSAGDNLHGYELWKSDGSVAGTAMLKDINPGVGNSSPFGMFAYKHNIFFGAYDGVNHALWKSDGTTNGTVQVKNIDPWLGSNVNYCISNHILYFAAIDYTSSKGTQIYKSDGTTAGTTLIKDINPDDTSYTLNSRFFTDVNGTVFFEGNDGVHGNELWKTDGSAGGTQFVDDITPGAASSNLSEFTSFKGKLYFRNAEIKADDFESRWYLWSSDGTAAGTAEAGDFGVSNINFIQPAGDKLFLSVYTQQLGLELYAGKANNNGKFVISDVVDKNKIIASLPFNTELYPNPAGNIINIKITSPNTKSLALSLTDISGKIILSKSIRASDGESVMQLDVSQLAAGIYFVKLMSLDGSEKAVKKFVKE